MTGERQGYFILNSQRINYLSDGLSPFKRTYILSQEIHFLVNYRKNEIALYIASIGVLTRRCNYSDLQTREFSSWIISNSVERKVTQS